MTDRVHTAVCRRDGFDAHLESRVLGSQICHEIMFGGSACGLFSEAILQLPDLALVLADRIGIVVADHTLHTEDRECARLCVWSWHTSSSLCATRSLGSV